MIPPPSSCGRARLGYIAVALCLLCCSLFVVHLALRAPIRSYLSSVTGEEQTWEQVKGFGRLIVLRLRQTPLQLAPDIPVAHAGVNPFGINTFLEQEVEPAKVEFALEMIHQAGFRWIRQEFPWEDIEQSARGDFWDHRWSISAWEKYDRIVDLANEQGLQVIARLDNPPAWSRAQGDAAGSLAPPDDYEDFGNFVLAVVARYRGRIAHYQIWNEPNIYPEWGEQPVDPAGYVRLLQVAYRRAKEADPNCLVLSAGLAQTTETGPRNLSDLTYLQQMYDAGVGGYFDIMGVMAYGLWTGPGDHRVSPELTNFSRPQLIRDIMVRNGDANKPLWATEVGWNSVPENFASFPLYGRVDIWQQARYAVEAYQRAQQEWPWMGVLNYWFFKRATDTEQDQVFYYFRMVEPDFTPLPVYQAVQSYANQPPRAYQGFHQEDHWALEWEGDWVRVDDERACLGALQRSSGSRDRVSFTFEGTELQLVVHKSAVGGTLAVTLDGKSVPDVMLSSEDDEYAVLMTVASDLPKGAHHVAIEARVGPGEQVDLDGFVVRTTARSWGRGVALVLILSALLLASLAVVQRHRT